MSKITQRQQDIILMLREGKNNQEIADELGLSRGTVRWHIKEIRRRHGVAGRAIAFGVEMTDEQLINSLKLNGAQTASILGIAPEESLGYIAATRLEELLAERDNREFLP